ncbi:CHY zinc finger protein [Bacillus coahuilensis]|uniref:CHY zinc finger protein n=1 Tax=Bacillus coahuilensis TaxID=408580 RepID=UPI0009E79C70|nr:CHY zinc finger protein [Bacillus coahuilensis]
MSKIKLKGINMDKETRCRHYHTVQDIIALKFKCCDTYYPCYECHQELTDHEPVRFHPIQDAQEKVVLCGHCQTEWTIGEYLQSNSACPACHSSFNPGCKSHLHLYFDGV